MPSTKINEVIEADDCVFTQFNRADFYIKDKLLCSYPAQYLIIEEINEK